MAALKSPPQPHGELREPGKHLAVQFAEESFEYTIEGKSIRYELLEGAMKGKSI